MKILRRKVRFFKRSGVILPFFMVRSPTPRPPPGHGRLEAPESLGREGEKISGEKGARESTWPPSLLKDLSHPQLIVACLSGKTATSRTAITRLGLHAINSQGLGWALHEPGKPPENSSATRQHPAQPNHARV